MARPRPIIGTSLWWSVRTASGVCRSAREPPRTCSERCTEAEDIARRLRRRAVLGEYTYAVEAVAQDAAAA